MLYRGWNYEKTLLIESKDALDRRGELMDAYISVPAEFGANLENDVRVVAKSDWNRYERELPCQVYGIERKDGVASFRVVFPVDIPPYGKKRIGVLYDNPGAVKPAYETGLDVSGSGLGLTVDTPHYTAALDRQSGQIARAVCKVRRVENTFLKEITPGGSVQPGVCIDFPVEENGAVACRSATAADWRDPPVVFSERGPLFFSITREAPMVLPAGVKMAEPPVLRVSYVFFADLPYLIVDSRLRFPADTGVFGVSMDILRADSAKLSHYTFRPVSPALQLTDVEEMGHLIIDPASVGDLPEGNMLSGFLPFDLAWHSFIQIRKGGWASRYSLTGINLRSSAAVPEGREPACYRKGSYIFREAGEVRWLRAPIYVKNRTRRENVIPVPAGSGYRETDALVFGPWDAEEWAQGIEALGKRLNTPLLVSSHPSLPGRTPPVDHGAIIEHGERHGAYLRAGVR